LCLENSSSGGASELTLSVWSARRLHDYLGTDVDPRIDRKHLRWRGGCNRTKGRSFKIWAWIAFIIGPLAFPLVFFFPNLHRKNGDLV